MWYVRSQGSCCSCASGVNDLYQVLTGVPCLYTALRLAIRRTSPPPLQRRLVQDTLPWNRLDVGQLSDEGTRGCGSRRYRLVMISASFLSNRHAKQRRDWGLRRFSSLRHGQGAQCQLLGPGSLSPLSKIILCALVQMCVLVGRAGLL